MTSTRSLANLNSLGTESKPQSAEDGAASGAGPDAQKEEIRRRHSSPAAFARRLERVGVYYPDDES